MIRVLHVVGGMDRGGAESYIMNLARNINRKKFKFIILTFLDAAGEKYVYEDELNELGFKIIKIEDTRFTNPWKFINAIGKVIKTEKIDVLHSHIDFMSGIALEAGKRTGINKLIAHSHSISNVKLTNPIAKIGATFLRKRLNRIATLKLACGKDAGDFLFGNENEYIIAKNGTDFEKYKYNSTLREQMRRKFKFSDNDLVLLTIGRLEAVKNQRFLLEIIEQGAQNFRLLIVGDGSLKEELLQEIADKRIEDKVFLVGAQDDVERYYNMADCFLLPSKFEGVPNVGVEAQVNQLPCIFSEHVPREIKLSEKVKFLTTDEKDAAGKWCNEITKMCNGKERNNRDASQISEELREYDIEKTVKQIEEIYNK